jgi:hypothetical protein
MKNVPVSTVLVVSVLFALVNAGNIHATNWDGTEFNYGPSPQMPNDGKWSHNTFWSTACQQTMGYVVRVPQQYLDNPTRRFPVLYYIYNSENFLFEWVSAANNNRPWWEYSGVTDPATGQDRPIIIIVPNGFVLQKWLDAKPGAPAANMKPNSALFELMDYMDANWRTVNSQKARAITGGSGGGVGCARASFTHPEKFAAAYIMNPACDDNTSNTVKPDGEYAGQLAYVCNGDGAYWDYNTIQNLVIVRRDAILAAGIRFKMASGAQDGLYTDGWSRDFFQQVVDLGLPHDVIDLPNGGHDFVLTTPQVDWCYSQFDLHPTCNGPAGLSTPQNTPLVASSAVVTANDADPQNLALNVDSVSNPQNGTVSVNNGTVTFTPTSGYTGPASFHYSVKNADGWTASGTASLTVTASTQCDTPSFNPGAGTYSSAQSVTISTTTSGATIRYTTDGSTPSSSYGTVYSGPVSINATTTLKAIAYKSGMTDSAVASGVFTINLPVVATPTFNPAAGTYSSAQSVTISTTTGGATIRYTTDGSTPSSSSGTIYSGPVAINATTTLKAIAYESGMTDSAVASGVYTINIPSVVATPTFSPVAGTYSSAQSVTISTTTGGATIRYTADGSTPSSGSGTIYSGPIAINATTTLKAIAYKSGMTDSAVASGVYVISSGGASGGNVGLNFAANSQSLPASDSAGAVVSFANWNNLANGAGSSSSVLDSTGGVSGITVAWDGFEGTWNSRNSAANGDEEMMRGYCDNQSGSATVTVANVTAASYDVYVYFGSDTDGRTGTVGIDGASTYSYKTYSSTHPFPSSHTVTTDTGTGYPSANYAVWQNLTASSFTMVFTLPAGGVNSGLNGMQIIMHGGTPPPTNTTSHGIPFSWLSSYGITNTSDSVETENPDGDSLNNLQEYIAGTDPTNRNSCFLVGITNVVGQIIVRVPSVQASGGKTRYYNIEQRTNLLLGSWQPVSGYTGMLGNGSIIACTNAIQNQGAFYRSKVWLQ